jgi:hypothetical protein
MYAQVMKTVWAVIILFVLPTAARAVEVNGVSQGGLITGVSNWETGWTTGSGWDYVGTVGSANGASGIYLGNGWVLTAGHVGAGDFYLQGNTYSLLADSSHAIVNADNSPADLVLYQITTSPDLAPLTLGSVSIGNPVVMIGYGGFTGQETWGYNTVSGIGAANNLIHAQADPPESYPFYSRYFGTKLGDGNNAQAVGGDSGGAGFVFNAATQQWELAGVMILIGPETVGGPNVYTYFADLNPYASQINGIMASSIPEPSVWTLMASGFGILLITGKAYRK